MLIDPSDLSGYERYKLLVSAVVPRPIAFVTTCDASGCVNLAPFSYFNAVTSNPMLISLCIGKRTWEGKRLKKDTAANIEAHGELVVNLATESLVDLVNDSAASYAPGESELEALGLTTLPSSRVKVPRLAESPVQLECTLDRIIELGERAETSLVIAKVVAVHVDPTFLEADEVSIDPNRLRPLARLGGAYYAHLGDLVERGRPAEPATKLSNESSE